MHPISPSFRGCGPISHYTWSLLCSFFSFCATFSIVFVASWQHVYPSLSWVLDLGWHLPGSHPGAPAPPLLAFNWDWMGKHLPRSPRALQQLNYCYLMDYWLCLLGSCFGGLLAHTWFFQAAHRSSPVGDATHRRHLFLQACRRDHPPPPLRHRPPPLFHLHLNPKTCVLILVGNWMSFQSRHHHVPLIIFAFALQSHHGRDQRKWT